MKTNQEIIEFCKQKIKINQKNKNLDDYVHIFNENEAYNNVINFIEEGENEQN